MSVQPIQMVNGYPCKDCTDVSDAKKHIDPAHPKDGPYGIYAKDDPSSPKYNPSNANSPAVTFGGVLANLNSNAVTGTQASTGASQAGSATTAQQPLSQRTGSLVNLVA